MKLILPCFISIVLLSSCAEHQYLTVSGVNIRKDDQNEFVYENDPFKIIYHFKPNYGKMLVSVSNRTDEPLVVDWWKSAMIIDSRVLFFIILMQGLMGRLTETLQVFEKLF
jgi:hypothetical protein